MNIRLFAFFVATSAVIGCPTLAGTCQLSENDKRLYFPQSFRSSSLVFINKNIAEGARISIDDLDFIEANYGEIQKMQKAGRLVLTSYSQANRMIAQHALLRGHILDA